MSAAAGWLHQPGIDIFDHLVADLPQLLARLITAPPAPVAEHEQIPNVPGIYLFSELDHAIYVGQTRILRDRLGNHTNPLGKNHQATFAFNVAKDEAAKAGIDTAKFRAQLEADQEFAHTSRPPSCGSRRWMSASSSWPAR